MNTVEVKRVNFLRVVKAEWIKAVSLKSTWITLALLMLVIIGFGLLSALSFSGRFGAAAAPPPEVIALVKPTDIVLSGATLAFLVTGTLGALMGAREYSSGLIRQTMTAVPRRLAVVLAKVGVFIVLTLPVALVTLALTFTLGMNILKEGGLDYLSWGDDRALFVVLGNAAYLVALGLIGMGLGFIFRSVAASISTLVGVVLILPGLLPLVLPSSWAKVLNYLPSEAAESFTMQEGGQLSTALGIVTFSLWLAAALGGALALVRARDV